MTDREREVAFKTNFKEIVRAMYEKFRARRGEGKSHIYAHMYAQRDWPYWQGYSILRHSLVWEPFIVTSHPYYSGEGRVRVKKTFFIPRLDDEKLERSAECAWEREMKLKEYRYEI